MALELFDAVRVSGLPGGAKAPYFSEVGTPQIEDGDIGVVIGIWGTDTYRVEAVRANGAIEWQDQFQPSQLERVDPTDAVFPRRRMNERWSRYLANDSNLQAGEPRERALSFARNVMAHVRANVAKLVRWLDDDGYQFANPDRRWRTPDPNVSAWVAEWAERGLHVPVALQAWLEVVGTVNLMGTHPDWIRTGYTGSGAGSDRTWYTDPLVIELGPDDMQFFYEMWVDAKADDANATPIIELAPDHVHKANVSGGEPIYMVGATPAFDAPFVGQHGSYTLLSYLRHAFEWAGFPGFDYIRSAPSEWLATGAKNLTRL